MSANSQPLRSSKWSSFLHQAVSGLETGLDRVLAVEDEHAPEGGHTERGDTRHGAHPTPKAPAGTPSTGRASDRLQERLARAMVKQPGTPESSTEILSRTPSPFKPTDGLTKSDNQREDAADNLAGEIRDGSQPVAPSAAERSHSRAGVAPSRTSQEVDDEPATSEASLPDRGQPHMPPPVGARGEIESLPDLPAINISSQPTEPVAESDTAISRSQTHHEAVETRLQDEIHVYIEKIDALQSKLKYLAKEAADSARKAAASAQPGSLEKKLLEKEEQIATLMEEGQKLSKTELDHRATIKKLRQYIAESTKSLSDANRRTEMAKKNLAKAEESAKRAELAERRAIAKLNTQSRNERQLEVVKAERDGFGATIQDLKSQLASALSRAEAAERRIKAESAESESRQVTELKDDLASARLERELSEGKLRKEIAELKDGVQRERERARLLELELRGEQSALENKMETLRAKAEEVSSSATGDAQAKLLRQIEILQSQYAVATENWHGIESSLLSRLASVEKERDEVAQKEDKARRKVREVTLKIKEIEAELENARGVSRELEHSLRAKGIERERLSSKLERADNDLVVSKREFLRQKEILEATWVQRLEDEKSKWHESRPIPSRNPPTRTESPVALSRRTEGLSAVSEWPGIRRSQIQGIDIPSRQNSSSSLTGNPALRVSPNDLSAPFADVPAATFEPEDYFNGSLTPATPSAQGAISQPARGINDIISVSTVGAGPSVQLVERMSASVRRLESERAALKDELGRLTAQRDEARQQIVVLMQEAEEKKAGDQRIKELEEALEELDQRYQTTLEMLGEKSEQVEEQKADIEDLKKIYRELVESMVK